MDIVLFLILGFSGTLLVRWVYCNDPVLYDDTYGRDLNKPIFWCMSPAGYVMFIVFIFLGPISLVFSIIALFITSSNSKTNGFVNWFSSPVCKKGKK